MDQGWGHLMGGQGQQRAGPWLWVTQGSTCVRFPRGCDNYTEAGGMMRGREGKKGSRQREQPPEEEWVGGCNCKWLEQGMWNSCINKAGEGEPSSNPLCHPSITRDPSRDHTRSVTLHSGEAVRVL